MKKRLLAMLLMVTMTISAFAYSFTGKTYSCTRNGATITVSFTSASRGTMTLKGDGKTEKKSFRYEISGDIINVYMNDGSDYIYIDNRHEYGEDSIFLVDDYGNPYAVLDRVATPAASGTKKKNTKR